MIFWIHVYLCILFPFNFLYHIKYNHSSIPDFFPASQRIRINYRFFYFFLNSPRTGARQHHIIILRPSDLSGQSSDRSGACERKWKRKRDRGTNDDIGGAAGNGRSCHSCHHPDIAARRCNAARWFHRVRAVRDLCAHPARCLPSHHVSRTANCILKQGDIGI